MFQVFVDEKAPRVCSLPMKFSQAKFLSLPPERRARKLYQLSREIEAAWLRGEDVGESLTTLRLLNDWAGGPLCLPVGDDRAAFIAAVRPLYLRFGGEPDDAALLVRTGDEPAAERSVIPLHVVLVNLRSAFNVGGVIRTAECVGAARVITCGCTPPADHPSVARTGMGAQGYIPCLHVPQPEDALELLRSEGITLVALETVEGAPTIHEYAAPQSCAIVLGNEALGLEPDLLRRTDACARIPVRGRKNSLNVGVAFGVCAYEILRQWTIEGRMV